MAPNCTAAFLLAYNPIYRFSSVYQMVFSFLSIFPLGYFLIFKLWRSSFHWNLKIIFIGYFVSMMGFSAIYTGTATVQSINPLVSVQPCDLMVPSLPHKLSLSTVSFFLTSSTFFPILITFERYFAMKNAKIYENMPIVLGPVLTGINFFTNFVIAWEVFIDEEFTDGSVSFSVLPAGAAQKMFTFYLILFCLNLLNLIFDFYLLKQNIHLKNELKNASLTTKYQLEEVYQSTKFSLILIFIHIFSFGIYMSAVVFFRYFGSIIVGNPQNLFGIRTTSTLVIPTYHCTLGIMAIVLFNRIKSKKSEGTTIQMSSIGNSGANNYDNAIFSIWNSVNTQSSTVVLV